jgi:pyrroloquinoline-quinone synthase
MNDVVAALDSHIAAKQLLDHPFYQRWNAGTLTADELREYARQYYHYALAFPTFLSAMHSHTADMATRQYLLENLIDEERGPENHPELWLRFCEALGLSRAEVESGTPNGATRALIDCIKRSCLDGRLHEGLAALYAYESQVPAVAAAKIAGLARWYAIDAPRDVAFFAVHLDADVAHAATSRALLERICDDDNSRAAAEASAQRTLGALYGFLDSVTAN